MVSIGSLPGSQSRQEVKGIQTSSAGLPLAPINYCFSVQPLTTEPRPFTWSNLWNGESLNVREATNNMTTVKRKCLTVKNTLRLFALSTCGTLQTEQEHIFLALIASVGQGRLNIQLD